jgi:hypothetical protein
MRPLSGAVSYKFPAIMELSVGSRGERKTRKAETVARGLA